MTAKGGYLSRGVSSDKEEVHAAITGSDKGAFPGAFCKLLPDPDGNPEQCVALHADGAGTKSSLAYVAYRETNDLSVFSGLAQDSAVMNLDDLLCVGATGPFVMSNTIGRNAHRISGEVVSAIIHGYSAFADRLADHGVSLVLAGGETADVGDLVQTLIVDSTVFTRVRRADVIDNDNIQPHDVIVGLCSFGKASYEGRYNAGMGSNGLTAARHLLFSKQYAEKYPESFSETIDPSLVYCGSHRLQDPLDGTGITIGEAVLSPTRTYAPVLMSLLRSSRSEIHGMVHCTGGGQTKCIRFGKNLRYVKQDLFHAPLFDLMEQDGGMEKKEMYKVFNMGHRMEIYCSMEFAPTVVQTAERFGIAAKIVGYIEPSDGQNRVVISDRGQTYEY